MPPELGSLYRLKTVRLSHNLLSGETPTELGRLPKLIDLWIGGGSQLTGCIPAGLRNVSGDFAQLGLPFCVSAATSGAAAGGPIWDRAVLVELYRATGGASWKDSTNWLSAAPIGEWYGVATDSSGRVIALDLAGNQLSGEMPSALGSLFRLERLGLYGNRLNGGIPPELGKLYNLESLGLSHNS